MSQLSPQLQCGGDIIESKGWAVVQLSHADGLCRLPGPAVEIVDAIDILHLANVGDSSQVKLLAEKRGRCGVLQACNLGMSSTHAGLNMTPLKVFGRN